MSKGRPGAVLYEGPSKLDGKPIVVIATERSENPKTGPMIQTWILRKDANPLRAIDRGWDRSICGDCPMRWRRATTDACYVSVHQAPLTVWRKYKWGGYGTKLHYTALRVYGRGKLIRVGSYGDPVAVPLPIWNELLWMAKGWTGYTHQWRRPEAQDYKLFLMASCNTTLEARKAQANGWRTFRVIGRQDEDYSMVMPDLREFSCPASKEEGNRLTCATCLACMGTRYGVIPKAASVKIMAH